MLRNKQDIRAMRNQETKIYLVSKWKKSEFKKKYLRGNTGWQEGFRKSVTDTTELRKKTCKQINKQETIELIGKETTESANEKQQQIKWENRGSV